MGVIAIAVLVGEPTRGGNYKERTTRRRVPVPGDVVVLQFPVRLI